jgi:hypothetical protein
MDAISAARSGVVSAMSALDGAGVNLSNAFSGGGGEPTAAVIAHIDASNALRASLKALKTTDNLFKALLDIKV